MTYNAGRTTVEVDRETTGKKHYFIKIPKKGVYWSPSRAYAVRQGKLAAKNMFPKTAIIIGIILTIRGCGKENGDFTLRRGKLYRVKSL